MAFGAVAPQQNEPPPDLPPLTKTTWLLIGLTIMAVMGGFLFGYDLGIVSGAMIIMRDDLNLDDLWQELIVSMTNAGAAVSSLFGGVLNAYFGRKYTILGSSLLFIVGAVMCAASNGKGVLLAGRIVLGIAIGACSCTIPAYVSECSPVHIRGRMITMWQLLIAFGFWIASLLAAALSYIKSESLSWRLMLGLAAVPAAIQFIGFIFMPESPRWLATHNREEEALCVMKRIYGNDHVAELHARHELNLIKQAEVEARREREAVGAVNGFPLLTVIRIPHLLKALIIGCTLQIFQQLCGINTIMYYSASIIQMSGVGSPSLAIWLASVTSGVNFWCTFIGIYLVEKIGRRPLTLGSVVGVFVCLLILGGSFTAISDQSPKAPVIENMTYVSPAGMPVINDSCVQLSCDQCSYDASCGFCYINGDPSNSGSCVSTSSYIGAYGDSRQWAAYGRCTRDFNASTDPLNFPFAHKNAVWDYGYCPTNLSWLPILGMVLYLVSFSIGFGPMPWTINAELYPNWVRSTGTSLSSACNWVCNILIAMTFLSLARAVTRQGAYFIYSGITLVGLVWFWLVLPETKNKHIEEIQYTLMGTSWFSCGKEPKETPALQRLRDQTHGRTRYEMSTIEAPPAYYKDPTVDHEEMDLRLRTAGGDDTKF